MPKGRPPKSKLPKSRLKKLGTEIEKLCDDAFERDTFDDRNKSQLLWIYEAKDKKDEIKIVQNLMGNAEDAGNILKDNLYHDIKEAREQLDVIEMNLTALLGTYTLNHNSPVHHKFNTRVKTLVEETRALQEELSHKKRHSKPGRRSKQESETQNWQDAIQKNPLEDSTLAALFRITPDSLRQIPRRHNDVIFEADFDALGSTQEKAEQLYSTIKQIFKNAGATPVNHFEDGHPDRLTIYTEDGRTIAKLHFQFHLGETPVNHIRSAIADIDTARQQQAIRKTA